MPNAQVQWVLTLGLRFVPRDRSSHSSRGTEPFLIPPFLILSVDIDDNSSLVQRKGGE
jgi:hypothetical protein